MPRRANARDKILEAAEWLVLEKGIDALAIDTVATMTGLGKGGVRYHFRYKVDLLQGLLERHIDRWNRMMDISVRKAGSDVYAWLDAFINFSFERKGELHRSGIAIFTAATRYAELTKPIRDFYKFRRDELFKQVKDPHLAEIILLATDGFSYFSALSVMPIDDSEIARIRNRMRSMVAKMREDAESH